MNNKLFFLNSFYYRGKFDRDPSTGRSIRTRDDFLFVNIKDCESNETHLRYFPVPKIDFYVTKEVDKYKYPQMSLPENELNKITCPYRDRERYLAKAVGKENEFFEALRSRTKFEFMRNFITNNPNLYMADMDIEDYYKNIFLEKYGRDVFKNNGKLKTGKLDIEVDQHGYFGPQVTGQNPACPINLITYYDRTENCLYAFILANQPDNSDMANMRQNPTKAMAEIKKEAKFECDVKLLWYDTEPELLIGFWENLHRMKPDFVGIWNMNFDIPYILNRMVRLGMSLEDICCHPEVPEEYRHVEYIEDSERQKRNFSAKGNTHPSRMWDWVNITGYTQFYDQMSLYSIIRKRNVLPSYKLDDISEAETGHKKVNYAALGYDIRNLAWQDFNIFLVYGCVDTIRLEQIELVTGDLEKQIIFADNTRLSKSTSISYRIKNSMYRQYIDRDPKRIIGNNVYYPIIERLEGAIVADPNNLRIKGMNIMNGIPTHVFENICDFDFTSLYPSVIINYQISKATLRGRVYKLSIDNLPHDHDEIGREINEMLQTRDTSIFEFMTKYYNLPSISDMMKLIENR